MEINKITLRKTGGLMVSYYTQNEAGFVKNITEECSAHPTKELMRALERLAIHCALFNGLVKSDALKPLDEMAKINANIFHKLMQQIEFVSLTVKLVGDRQCCVVVAKRMHYNKRKTPLSTTLIFEDEEYVGACDLFEVIEQVQDLVCDYLKGQYGEDLFDNIPNEAGATIEELEEVFGETNVD